MGIPRVGTAILWVVLLAACAGGDEPPPPAGAGPDATASAPAPLAPEQEAFWNNLSAHCGRAYPGYAAVIVPGDARRDSLYAGKEMVAHFRQCFDDRLLIPGHIGDDRSRTWILSRVDGGLDLRHDHRNPDGTDASNTMYGASTIDAGMPLRQDFVRVEGVGRWVLELVPGERFSYGNHNDQEWLVRFDFDLTRPIDPPPAPWGYEDTEPVPLLE